MRSRTEPRFVCGSFTHSSPSLATSLPASVPQPFITLLIRSPTQTPEGATSSRAQPVAADRAGVDADRQELVAGTVINHRTPGARAHVARRAPTASVEVERSALVSACPRGGSSSDGGCGGGISWACVASSRRLGAVPKRRKAARADGRESTQRGPEEGRVRLLILSFVPAASGTCADGHPETCSVLGEPACEGTDYNCSI